MLLAVVAEGHVGVDLECEQRGIDPLAISKRIFSGADLTAITGSEPGQMRDVFFRKWVSMEAALKAKGLGFRFAHDSQMRVGNLLEGMLPETRDAHPLQSDWPVYVLNCDPGWYAAVSMQMGSWKIVQPSVAI